jgi:hypothetical protein
MAFDDTGDLVLLWALGYDGLQIRLFDPQGAPLGPPVDVNSDSHDDPWGRSEPWGGDLAWKGNSLLVAWVASIFPYDQSSIFVRWFVKSKADASAERPASTK